MKYDVIIVGAGFAGATIANVLANKNKKVLVIDKRGQIGGNAADYFTKKEHLLVHKYGPHIFHTNYNEVWNYLKPFTKWFKYQHKVLGNIDGKLVPIPFNFKSLELTHSKKDAKIIKKLLLKEFKNKEKVSILDLKNHKNKTLQNFGEFVYEKVFVHYTSKQWGIHPDKIDKSVINRVPILLSYHDTYFLDKEQWMPKNGYQDIFKNMLKHKNITVKLKTNIRKMATLKNNKIYINKELFKGPFVYTGAIDELFNYKFGVLPYRSLDIKNELHKVKYYQKTGTVNFPTSEKFTRISEYKHFLPNGHKSKEIKMTITAKEFSKAYSLNCGTDPYYPINNPKNNNMYLKYKDLSDKFKNIYLCGRLAEYKYYNMDITILNALKLAKEINNLLKSK